MSSKPVKQQTTYVPAVGNGEKITAVKKEGKIVEFHRLDAIKRYCKKNDYKYFFKDVRIVTINQL